MNPFRQAPGTWIACLAAVLAACPADTHAAELGGSFRSYVFLLDNSSGPEETHPRHAELALLRFTGEFDLNEGWRLVAHSLTGFQSPPTTLVTGVAEATAPRFLPLQTSLASRSGAEFDVALDRLYAQGRLGTARIVAGRQAITWGTNYFWPALDLFAPFRPGQVDRDYKPGVDALRLTLPVGDFSEVEAIGAVLGSSASSDEAFGALARINVGRADFGFMAGRFSGETVLGSFFAADIAGTGWRAELSWTDAAEVDPLAGGSTWRWSAGLDRMMSPTVVLTAELAWNGFGVRDPSLYPALAASKRVQRGQLNALGRRHAGVALDWEFHPLWHLHQSVLLNIDEPSALWTPSLRWSVANEVEVIFGAQAPFGPGASPDGTPRSEFGVVPASVFAGIKCYF